MTSIRLLKSPTFSRNREKIPRSLNYLIENTLNYVKDFGTSRINAVGGYSWQAWQSRGIGTPASGFVNDNLTFENFESATSPGISNTRHQEWALSSFLGRINYSLLDRYLFTVTGRADGSTRLAAGNKWAFFPSAAIGWRIDKEPFMKNVKSINNLKLRASYGVSGNQNINIGATQNNLNTDRYPIGGTIINGYVLQNIANPNLGWETTSQYNVGMDLGLWKNRVKLEANYYHKTTTDLLISLPIPSTTGFGSYIANSGEVQNNGLEIDLTARILTKKFKWSLLGNISFNRNEMKSLGLLGDDALIFGPSYLGAGNALNQPIHVAAVGNPIGSFYGYQVDGVYQNQQEVDQGAESNAKPGDIRFVDINDECWFGQEKFGLSYTTKISSRSLITRSLALISMYFLVKSIVNAVKNFFPARKPSSLCGSCLHGISQLPKILYQSDCPGVLYQTAIQHLHPVRLASEPNLPPMKLFVLLLVQDPPQDRIRAARLAAHAHGWGYPKNP